jgi:uncharacterized UPF0160 family protein
MRVITHDGTFHTDEVFAIALLKKFVNSNIEVIRTREEAILTESKEDKNIFVIDVGREYNFHKRNFDHHQREFNKTWNNDNTLFSSCGLIWDFLKKRGYLKKYSKFTLINIEKKLIKKIDAHDNGQFFWSMSNMIKLCNREDNKMEDFNKGLSLAKIYIDNIFHQECHSDKLNQIFQKDLEKYDNNKIFFSSISNNSSFLKHLSQKTNAAIIIYEQKYGEDSSRWYSKAITKQEVCQQVDKNCIFSALAPESWRGLSDDELKVRTGMQNVVFVHKTGYLCVSKNKKTAINMANAMLTNIEKIRTLN